MSGIYRAIDSIVVRLDTNKTLGIYVNQSMDMLLLNKNKKFAFFLLPDGRVVAMIMAFWGNLQECA